MPQTKEKIFTQYQVFIIAVLAFLQFTVILDFMVLSPLGVILMKTLDITPSKFSVVVSAYAFSAGASGLLAAGFADKFDRKKLLLFFYAGFILGTALCAIAPNFEFLLMARIVTGLFGGVIGSISMAIITDIFAMQVRGRVMGYIQMSFSGAQVLGIPIGLWLANNFGWHWCFWMIAVIGVVAGIIMAMKMQPVDEHLKVPQDRNALHHLFTTVSKPKYVFGFLAMSTLASGGFMLMPFGSAFGTHNMGLTLEELPILYLVTGIFSMLAGPLVGKLSDKIGKFKVFVIGSVVAMASVIVYTNLGITPLWLACAISIVLFTAVMARMIPASATMTALPTMADRGAFMSVNSAMMQIAGGIAAVVAGQIVGQTSAGMILHYDTLGYVVVGAMIAMVIMMYFIDRMIKVTPPQHFPAPGSGAVPEEEPLPEFAGEIL